MGIARTRSTQIALKESFLHHMAIHTFCDFCGSYRFWILHWLNLRRDSQDFAPTMHSSGRKFIWWGREIVRQKQGFHPMKWIIIFFRSLRAGEEMRSLRSLLGAASPGGNHSKNGGATPNGAATPAEDAGQAKEKTGNSSAEHSMTKKVADSGFETSPKCNEKTFARSESTLWQGKGIVWGYANSRLFYSLTDGAKEILLSPTPDFRSPASSRNNSLRASINLNAKTESKSEAIAQKAESEVAPKNDELPPRRQTPPTKLAPSRFKKRWNLSQHLLVTEPSYTILCWCSNF